MKKNNIDYSEWLCDNLDNTIRYTEYLAESVNIQTFSKYDGTISDSDEIMSEKHYQRKIKIMSLLNSFKDDEITELKKEIEILKNVK